MRLFERTFSVSSHTRILDVGGSPAIWQFLSSRPQVTILNFPSALEPGTHGMELVAGDGCQLPFADRAFDIVFSNSVIEHVGGPAAQKRFAEEIMRTGKRYWVQTPDRSFPVEPHLLTSSSATRSSNMWAAPLPRSVLPKRSCEQASATGCKRRTAVFRSSRI